MEKLTERALQFAALVLGAKAAHVRLLEFYVSRGIEEEAAQALMVVQARKVRIVAIPLGLALMLIGFYSRSLAVTSPELAPILYVMTYLGFFLLCCQLAAGRSASSPWKSVKEMLKK